MELLEAIRTRRSIRRFTVQPVPGAVEKTLLRAAMAAPSALDQRPWEFVLVRDRERLQGWSRDWDKCEMLASTALGLLVCGNTDREKLPGYWVQDCCACTQNILLAAHDQGLGAVWIAVDFEPRRGRLCADLHLLPPIHPLALVALGYPDEQWPAEDRYDRQRVHEETW